MTPRIGRTLRALASIIPLLVGALTTRLEAQSVWQVKASNTASSLNAVVFGNGLFVAVGDGGAIVTSPDGEVWTPRVSGTTDQLPSIAFGNGRFVATRVNRSIPAITSADGITWTPMSVTNADGTVAATGAYDTIVFGGGSFLAGGSKSSGRFELISSGDGMSFRTVTAVSGVLLGATKWLGFFRGQFYAYTYGWGLYTSPDTISWTHSGWVVFSNGDYSPVLATDGVSRIASLGFGSGNYSFSVDAGHTFQRSEQPLDRYQPEPISTSGYSLPTFRAACYGAGSFVAVDSKGGPWTSERGEFWLPRGHYATAEEGFRGVAFNGVDRFVAVGSAPASGSALIAVAAADTPPPPPAYTVYNLKDLSNGVFNDEPRSISNSGIIAGSILLPRGRAAAILRDGNVTAYPGLFYGQSSYANSVNDNGIAAAEMLITSVGLSTYTVGATLPDLAQTFPGAGLYSTYSTAPSINSNGLIAGAYYDYNRTQVGIYRYDTSTGDTVDLGNFGLSKINALSINDRGDIAGSYVYEFDSSKSNDHLRPFRLSADGRLDLIPTLGGTYIYHVVMNSSGDVAGSSTMPYAPPSLFQTHAFLFKDGITTDIDLLNSKGSVANGMNNQGDVVGQFSIPNPEVWQHSGGNAFLYRNGMMYDLNRLLDSSGDGWVLYRATSINDNGWIVGQGWLHGEHSQPFLAIPAAGKPAGIQTRFVNVSTRLRTGAGDDVLIGGFIIRGGPKRVILRALGPAISYLGYKVPSLLSDPTLELFDERGQRIAFNDNYTDLPYFPDRNEIGIYGLTPAYGGMTCLDSVIAATLGEGNYTAVVRGKNGVTGNCLVELYNVDTDYSPALVNISTRGPVGTGDDVMIAGFIIRGDRERRVLIRGIGPSLAGSSVPTPLMDPTLEIHDQNGQIAANDDWRSDQEAEIRAAGFAPGDEREAAVILTLWPGNYTAIVRGKADSSGNALVEVYQLPDPN